MRAYPDSLLKTSLILEEVQTLLSNANPGSPQLVEAVKLLKTKIYKPPFWIRVGLFIATWLGGLFCMSWFGLIFFGILDEFFSSDFSGFLMSVISAVAAFVVARRFIETKNHFCSGIDDALGLACLLSLGVAAFLLREMLNLPPLSWYSLLLASGVAACFSGYYLDRFMAFIALLLLLFGLYKLVLIMPLGMLILPFVYLLTGLILWTVNRGWQKKNHLFYEHLVDFVEVCSLCLIVLSPQFVLVEFAFHMLMNAVGPLPYGTAFQIFSFAIPLFMLGMGWKQKNRAMLWVGLLGFAFGFYSIATSVWYWPVESCLLLIGGAFSALGYSLHTLLKNNQLPGFDLNAGAKAHFLQDVVSQVIQTTTATDRPEPKVEPKFGGGEFGGAGATGDF